MTHPFDPVSKAAFGRLRTRSLFPVFLSRRDGRQLVFDCPLCAKPHFHGGGDTPGDADGHRAPHCNMWKRGYFIVEAVAPGIALNASTFHAHRTLRRLASTFEPLDDDEAYHLWLELWEEEAADVMEAWPVEALRRYVYTGETLDA